LSCRVNSRPLGKVDLCGRRGSQNPVLLRLIFDHMDRIPLDLLEEKRRTIGEMEVGETAWSILETALSVDSEGRCWLERAVDIYPAGGRAMLFEIRREKDGYHIVIPRQQYQRRMPSAPWSELAVSVTFREGD
jgi:hypothetical protein